MSMVVRITQIASRAPASALIDAIGMGALTALIVVGFGLS